MKEQQLIITNLSDSTIEPVVWLWKNKIPRGSMTIFSGPAGVGKTLVLLDIIARYTTGTEWPDGSPNSVEPGAVLLLNSEDHKTQSVLPRLLAANFKPGSVHVLEGKVLPDDAKKKVRTIALLSDLDLIEKFLTENPQVGLVVIDPISNYLGSKNMNNSQDVRDCLTPVRNLAEKLNITIVCNSHFNKSKKGDTTALGKIGGSSALHEIPRAVWEFGRDAEDHSLYHFVLAKGNETGSKKGMAYGIDGKDVTDKGVTVQDIGFIVWKGEEELDADELFATPTEETEQHVTKVASARDFIISYVAQERASTDVFAVGASRGYNEKMLKRAKRDLPTIVCYEKGNPKRWYWNTVHGKPQPFPTHIVKLAPGATHEVVQTPGDNASGAASDKTTLYD